MEAYQERVVTEKYELDEKIYALDSFIWGTIYRELPEGEQLRLVDQYGYMKQYSRVLGERIAAFK